MKRAICALLGSIFVMSSMVGYSVKINIMSKTEKRKYIFIANKLFREYLESFKDPKTPPDERLLDYRIKKIEFDRTKEMDEEMRYNFTTNERIIILERYLVTQRLKADPVRFEYEYHDVPKEAVEALEGDILRKIQMGILTEEVFK